MGLEKDKDVMELKDFIYLDTNFVTSVLAQIYRGKILNQMQENKDFDLQGDYEQEKGLKSRLTLGTAGKLNMKVFGTEYNGEYSVEEDNGINSNIGFMGKSQKETINKTFDDDAFDIIFNFLNAHNLIKIKDEKSLIKDGDYLLINDTIRIFDIEYLTNAISDKDLKKMLISSTKKNPSDAVTKAQKLSNDLSTVEQMLKVIKILFPMKYLILSGNLLLITNNEFFRYKESLLSLRDNTKVVILAKIIKKHNKDADFDQLQVENSFSDMHRVFNTTSGLTDTIVSAMFPNQRGRIFYAQPIAIY